jgi:hypothetical protein
MLSRVIELGSREDKGEGVDMFGMKASVVWAMGVLLAAGVASDVGYGILRYVATLL